MDNNDRRDFERTRRDGIKSFALVAVTYWDVEE